MFEMKENVGATTFSSECIQLLLTRTVGWEISQVIALDLEYLPTSKIEITSRYNLNRCYLIEFPFLFKPRVGAELEINIDVH